MSKKGGFGHLADLRGLAKEMGVVLFTWVATPMHAMTLSLI